MAKFPVYIQAEGIENLQIGEAEIVDGCMEVKLFRRYQKFADKFHMFLSKFEPAGLKTHPLPSVNVTVMEAKGDN